MSDIYARPDLTKKVRYNNRATEEREEKEVEIYESADGFRNDDHVGTQEIKRENVTILQNGGLQRRSLQVVTVALGLLCLLLLAGIIDLAIHYNSAIVDRHILVTERDHLNISQSHLQTSYDNVTRERNQLQTRYDTVTRERNQLKNSYDNVTRERNQLQTRYDTVTRERNQFQTSYDTVTRERNQFQTEVNKLKEIFHKPGWQMFNSSCYYVSTGKKTWQDSRADCLSRGADLVVITSTEEQEFIRGLNVRRETWIGLKDEGHWNSVEWNVKWRWVDRTALAAGYWGKGQYYNCYSGCCATQLNGTWKRVGCNNPNYWVCEIQIVLMGRTIKKR